MVDYVLVPTETAGTKIAVDNIGGINYQRLKFNLGDVGIDDGPVSEANPMPTYIVGGIEGEDISSHLTGVGVKPVASLTYSGIPYFSHADVSYTPAIGVAPCQLMSVWVSNVGSSLLFVQVHNRITDPTGGQAPVYIKPLPAGSATVPGICNIGVQELGVSGLYLSTGLTIAVSSVFATYTAHNTAADLEMAIVAK